MNELIFLGDSVTDCQRKRAERYDQTEAGYGNGWVRFVASHLSSSGQAPKIWNRGYSGCLTEELSSQERWWPQEDQQNRHPDVATLMIGINDIWHPFWKEYDHQLDQVLEAYRALVLTLKDRAKLVVLMEPVALLCGDVSAQWWQPLEQLTLGQATIAKELKVQWVPLQTALQRQAEGRPEEYLYDGVHPTELGHRWLAEQWLRAVAHS